MLTAAVQGEVEQISLMKAKGETKEDTGLLEYLEDIIGTDQYVDAIEAAAAELEQLNEKRQTFVTRAKAAGACAVPYKLLRKLCHDRLPCAAALPCCLACGADVLSFSLTTRFCMNLVRRFKVPALLQGRTVMTWRTHAMRRWRTAPRRSSTCRTTSCSALSTGCGAMRPCTRRRSRLRS